MEPLHAKKLMEPMDDKKVIEFLNKRVEELVISAKFAERGEQKQKDKVSALKYANMKLKKCLKKLSVSIALWEDENEDEADYYSSDEDEGENG